MPLEEIPPPEEDACTIEVDWYTIVASIYKDLGNGEIKFYLMC